MESQDEPEPIQNDVQGPLEKMEKSILARPVAMFVLLSLIVLVAGFFLFVKPEKSHVLRVDVGPEDGLEATVTVFDGRQVVGQAVTTQGSATFELSESEPGRFLIEVTKPGYETVQKSFSGKSVMRFDLVRMPEVPTVTPVPSPVPSIDPVPTGIPSPTPTPTIWAVTPTPTPTTTPSVTPTATPTPTLTPSPTPGVQQLADPTFNVKQGCRYQSVTLQAVGDGIQDDTVAIQNCLMAAGLHWRQTRLNGTNASDLTRRVRVELPEGDYFVQGRFLTAYPLHSEDIGYPPHYGVFIVPPGVAVSGAGASKTHIILERGSRENRVAGQGTRIGTHVFLAGYEKGVVPQGWDMNSYCRQLPEAARTLLCAQNGTNQSIKTFCAQLVGQVPAGMASDLCPWEHGLNGSMLKDVSGSFITFENLQIRGDREALLGWYAPDSKSTVAFSSAIVVYRGNDFNAREIRVDDFYRTLWLRQNRGIAVTNSEFHNGHKSTVFIETPVDTPKILLAGAAVPFDVRNRIESNRITTDLPFLQRMKVNEKKNVFTGYHVFMGVAILGNNNLQCEDTLIRDNEFTLNRIDLTTPCRRTIIEKNRFEYNALPLRLGNQLDRWGMGFRRVAEGQYQVEVLNNVVRHSLSGVALAGCNDRNASGARCNAVLRNQVLIADNRFEDFLPFSNDLTLFDSAREPEYWVNKMHSFAEDRVPAAIGVMDINGVDILNNTITGLKHGSQIFGIGVLSSIHNLRNATHPYANCYGPTEYNKNFQITGNRVAFDSNGPIEPPVVPGESVGLYVENTLDAYVSGNFITADSNRLINTRLSNANSTDLSSCQRTLFQTNATCARRVQYNAHYMETARQQWLAKKCATNSSGAECVAYGYCLNQTQHPDEVFILPWIRNPGMN